MNLELILSTGNSHRINNVYDNLEEMTKKWEHCKKKNKMLRFESENNGYYLSVHPDHIIAMQIPKE
jgi:hypothetical protein